MVAFDQANFRHKLTDLQDDVLDDRAQDRCPIEMPRPVNA